MRSRFQLVIPAFVGAVLTSVVVAWLSPAPAEGAYSPMPSGAIVFLNRTVATGCPSGWTEFTALRGRYVVGVPSAAASAGLTDGTALATQEDRAVGQHTHTLTVTLSDPGHTHTKATALLAQGASGTGFFVTDPGAGGSQSYTTGSATTGITVSTATAANTGAVAGTPAPYVQLLPCIKS